MNPKPKGLVRVRLAPSPTGSMHIGTARTGLFNWLFARQHGGEFLLRIEDTDKERSEKKYEADIIDGLKWLGLDWDQEIYRQSERTLVYRKYLQMLLDEGKAYYCYCSKEDLEAAREDMVTSGLSPKYSGHCREIKETPEGKQPNVIRFKTPEAVVEFKDMIRGKVKSDAGLLGDMVIAKDLDTPLYNFAAAVDDYEMKITHVIRGEDHISNTPKQILIQKALGFDEPIYAHLPLILGSDRSKLSKRNGEVSLLSYREQGYLREGILNFLVLLGWHPQGDEEVFELQDLIKVFNLQKVQKGGAIFDREKLNWINGEHIKRLDEGELYERLKIFIKGRNGDYEEKLVKKVIGVLKDRMKLLTDFFELSDFFFKFPDYDVDLLKWKDRSLPDTEVMLTKILEVVGRTDERGFDETGLRSLVESLAGEGGRGEALWPFRVALSGKKASPDPFVIAEILGKRETVRRVKLAIEKLSNI